MTKSRTILGEEFSAPVERAWADTIDMIIKSMLGPVTEEASVQTLGS